MSDGKKYYCFCSSNCKYETMTKEQILAAIAQAVETGSVSNCDTGFITKVKEINGGGYVTFWVGTQAQYNALENVQRNCLYIITDDTTGKEVIAACAAAKEEFDAHLVNHVTLEGKFINEREFVKYHGDGLSECWYRLRVENVPITTQSGGLYRSSAVYLPYPTCVKESIAQSSFSFKPIACEMVVTGTDDVDAGRVALFTSGALTDEHTQAVTFTSFEPVTTSVEVTMHIVWHRPMKIGSVTGGGAGTVGGASGGGNGMIGGSTTTTAPSIDWSEVQG
jgi:hypothetical protein